MQIITKRLFFICILLLAFAAEAYEQVRAGTLVRRRVVEGEDSIIYEEDTEVKESSRLKEMSGTWKIVSLKKQASLPSEKIDGYYLQIKNDSSFDGRTPCSLYAGKLKLRGNAIRFEPQKTQTVACNQAETEIVYFNLLREAVVSFSVYPKNLELRTGSGVVVLEGVKPEPKKQ